MNMLEKVARAIYEANGQTLNLPAETVARAAIQAMREPTNEMIQAGHRADPLACDVSESQVTYCYTEMWQAMIDETLK